jgi:hypothetical protein
MIHECAHIRELFHPLAMRKALASADSILGAFLSWILQILESTVSMRIAKPLTEASCPAISNIGFVCRVVFWMGSNLKTIPLHSESQSMISIECVGADVAISDHLLTIDGRISTFVAN